MRGAWDSALVSLDRLYAERPVLAFAGARFATGVMAYWTGALERDAALARRRELADHRVPEATMVAASRLLAFLDGIVAYADRNPAGIDSARAALRAVSSDAAAAWLERALAAFQIDLQGNSAQAADSLLAIDRRRGGENVFDYSPVPFIRLLAGRIKAEEGQSAIADSLMSYYETGVATVSAQLVLKQTAGLAAFERGRAWDRAGDADRAARFYRDFLRLYDRPPTPHRPYVEEALSALAQLAGNADRGGGHKP